MTTYIKFTDRLTVPIAQITTLQKHGTGLGNNATLVLGGGRPREVDVTDEAWGKLRREGFIELEFPAFEGSSSMNPVLINPSQVALKVFERGDGSLLLPTGDAISLTAEQTAKLQAAMEPPIAMGGAFLS